MAAVLQNSSYLLNKIKTIIVEDEIHARNHLRTCLDHHPDLDLVAECADGKSAISKIKEFQPELLFLDIRIPEPDGFGVLRALPANQIPLTIFVTAFDDYALQAFEVFACDYILKPYEDSRINISVERAKKIIASPQLADEVERISALLKDKTITHPSEFLPVKNRNRIVIIPVEEIDWIEAYGDYVKIHSGDRQHLHYTTMQELETKLQNKFVRIHRSALVQVDRIKELSPILRGDYQIILKNGTKLRLSRNYKENLKNIF
jgi:two-component system LytT family response regulator